MSGGSFDYNALSFGRIASMADKSDVRNYLLLGFIIIYGWRTSVKLSKLVVQ